MHVAVDLNWFLQFVLLALAAALGFLYLLRNTASRYFVVDFNFASTAADFSSDSNIGVATMATPPGGGEKVSDACAVCGLRTTKHCGGCKMVKYCSADCQKSHWNSEHKTKCKLQFNKANHTQSNSVLKERKASLVPARGSLKIFKESNKILFPYEEFVKFFDWEKPDYPPPCGLLNCGNSCFANVILQCLSYTRPLVAYLMGRGHKMECRMDNWCFLCEFQEHVETATRSSNPFSPINILSRLRSIGGNLDYGQQQDAHEFMRLAIDTMQSVCLDEFGGERAVHPNYQQTTLIQHIFGGRLQSQVICTECNNVSNQFENMMDLTVEIHGDAETLEECLDQYTAKEELHGDNKYKCDGCNAYVTAWKRLSIQQAPNILTIALKRFQSGRFGKLNKRVTFPETLNLNSYMGELEDGNNYMLYAVIVHLDMLNASYFGHYICYVKDFGGNWYKIDDNEVNRVQLDEVLSQGAYMLLYKRIHARLSCLLPVESCNKQENANVATQAVDPSVEQPIERVSAAGLDNLVDSGNSSSTDCSRASVDIDVSTITEPADAKQDVKLVSAEASLPVMNGEIVNFEVGPKQFGVANDTVEPVPVSTSLIDNSPMELDANEVVPSISYVENLNVVNGINAEQGLERILTDEPPAANGINAEQGLDRMLTDEPPAANGINAEQGLERMLTDEPPADENHKKGKESNISPVTTAEVQETNSANGTSMSDNAECRNGAILLDNDNNKAAKNSNGESSRAKLKPIFFPGFLDRPSHKGPVQKSKMTKEVKKMLKIPPNEQINEAMKVEENPCSVLQNGSVSTNSASNKSLKKGDSEPSSCIHCKYHNSNNKSNATGSRAAKPCC